MSVREEDRQRNCPGRGLGVAAAAIGVGVGAALYYFFSKRQENPDPQGSTTDWACEDALSNSTASEDSEASSDMESSIHTVPTSDDSSPEEVDTSNFSSVSTVSSASVGSSWEVPTDHSYTTISEHSTTDTSINSTIEIETSVNSESSLDDGAFFVSPEIRTARRLIMQYYNSIVCKRAEEVRKVAEAREKQFRERAWALEECSICFESMQRSHEVLALGCSHRFHQACILPWLQQRQTCPNCRRDA